MTDFVTLFPDPFDDEFRKKTRPEVQAANTPQRPARTTSIKPDAPVVPMDPFAEMEQWEALESSVETAPPKVAPSPAAMASVTPPSPAALAAAATPSKPARTPAPTAAAPASPVPAPRAPATAAAAAKKPEVIETTEKSAEDQLKELDLILNSISTDDLDSF